MFSFIDQCEDQLLNKHSVPLLDIVVAFTVGFIVGKVAGHLNDLYLKKKILRKAIELPILGQNLDNCGSAQEMQYGF